MYVVVGRDDAARTELPLYLVTAGMNHRQEMRRRPNGAAFYQLLTVTGGSGILETEGGTTRLSEGMTVFTAKDAPCAYYADGGELFTGWVAFEGKEVERILAYLGAERVAILASDAVRRGVEEISRRAEHGAPTVELSALLYRLLATFFGALSESERPTSLIAARDFIEKGYARDLSVREIATAAGISESLLYRLFRSEEGMTPSEYLRSVRIRHAKELLLEGGGMRIAEIAERVGFSDAAYFCKVFRADTGITPRAFRLRYTQ